MRRNRIVGFKCFDPQSFNTSCFKSHISPNTSNPVDYTFECHYGPIDWAPHPCLPGAICLSQGSWGLFPSTHGTQVTPSSFPSGHMLTRLLYLTKLNFLLHCLELHHQNRAQQSQSVFPMARFAYVPLYKNSLSLSFTERGLSLCFFHSTVSFRLPPSFPTSTGLSNG